MLWMLAALFLAGPTPESLQAQERLKEGQRFMGQEKFEAAALAFRDAIRLDPILVMAHHGLGQSQMALKRYPEAVVAFQGAQDAFQKRVAESVIRGFENESARADRIRHLQDRIRDNSERALAPGSPAATLRDQRIQEWELEIATLQRSQGVKAAPRMPAGLSHALGSAYFRSGKLADAEREYRAALEAQPRLGEPRNNLAVVLLLTGRPSEAKDELQLAEKNGFKAHPDLKKDIESALAKASNAPTS
jgi:protein O-GlcNAc transferase